MPETATGSPSLTRDPLLERLRLATAGTYDIVGELGRGGMAVVFTGTDLKLQRRVAIKVMDPRLSMTQGMAERFLQEARIAARLQHPNIIVVHDVRQDDEIIFFVMSLIDGIAVDELCRQDERVPIDQIRWILLQSARALAYAHAEGIVHRDIKPANILLNAKGDVVLTDFGIAKALGDNGLTQSGMQVGTPMYMSPEQFSGAFVGPASDQYALGVMAYQMITGRPPFSGDLYQLIASHGNRVPEPIRAIRPDCPAFLANAVMRMLEKQQDDRWASLEDLQEVFGANMAMDGGAARRELSQKVREIRPGSGAGARLGSARTSSGSSHPSLPTPSSARGIPDTLVVTISPPGATVFVSGVLQLRASVAMDTGQSLPGAGVEWTSSDESVLVVQPNGTVVGVAPGSAIVRAAVNGGGSEATIRVEAAPIARLSMTVPQLTLRVGDVAQPHVTAIDVNGVARSDVAMSWISRSPGIADVPAPGTVRAIAPGTAVIDVAAGNVRRSFDVAVLRRPVATLRIDAPRAFLELGDAAVLALKAFDDLGQEADSPSALWTSSAPSIIHVDSTGCVLAIAAGEARITAAIDDATDSIDLESLEPPVGSIQLTANPSSCEVGEDVALSIRVKDLHGNSRSTAGVRVWSSAPEIVQINVDGNTATALAVGEATLHAAASENGAAGVEDSTLTVTVLNVRVARLELFPSSLDLEMGSVAAVHLEAFDRRSRSVPHTHVQWVTEAPNVAVMEGDSAIRGLSQGRTQIQARFTNADGSVCTASLAIRVRRASVSRLAVTAEKSMLEVGEQVSLRAVTWDASDAEVTDAMPTWRSTHPAIARVEGNGVVYALEPGRTTITAELDGKSGQLAMLVAPSSVASLSLSPPTVDGIVGLPISLVAKAIDRNGRPTNPSLQWVVEPSDAAHVSDDGVVLPLTPCTFTVRASLPVPTDATGILSARSELHATATVQARSPKALSIDFALPRLQLVPGGRKGAELRSRTEAGNSLASSALSWRSDNDAVATVDDKGLVLAVAPGIARVFVSADQITAELQVVVAEARSGGGVRRTAFLAGGAVVISVLGWLVWSTRNARATTPQDSANGGVSTHPDTSSVGERADSSRLTVIDTSKKTKVVKGTSVAEIAVQNRGAKVVAKIPSAETTKKEEAPGPPVEKTRDVLAAEPARTTTAVRVADLPLVAGNSVPPTGTSEPDKPRPPVTVAPAAPVAAAVAVAPVAAVVIAEVPSAAELRSIVDQIAREVLNGDRRPTAELKQFLGDGDGHKVSGGAPSNVGDSDQGRVRAQFDLMLSRFNSGGATERRISVVRIEVAKRNGAVGLVSITFGPIVKPGR